MSPLIIMECIETMMYGWIGIACHLPMKALSHERDAHIATARAECWFKKESQKVGLSIQISDTSWSPQRTIDRRVLRQQRFEARLEEQRSQMLPNTWGPVQNEDGGLLSTVPGKQCIQSTKAFSLPQSLTICYSLFVCFSVCYLMLF